MTKAQILERMKKIHVGAEGRNLTADEQAEWDKLSGQIETMKRGAAFADDTAPAPVAGTNRQIPNGAFDMPGDTGTRSTTTARFLTAAGREVKSWAPGEAMADAEFRGRMAERGVNVDNVSIGRLIVAGVTRSDKGLTDDEQRLLRDQSTVSNTGGGYLVNDSLNPLVYDMARAQSCYLQAGARTVQMGSDLERIVTVESDPTLEFKSELASFSGSSVSFGAIQLAAQTYGTTVMLSRELIQDASNASSEVESVLAKAIGAGIDSIAINGTGSEQPTGLVNSTGVRALDAVDTWEKLLDRAAVLEGADTPPNAYLLNAALNNTLRKLRSNTEGDGPWLAMPDDVKAMRRIVSSKIPNSTLILGDFSQALLGVRMGVEITSDDRGDRFDKFAIQLRAVCRFAPGLVRGAAFAVCAD